jgi:pimeloyl-ACP methyl ester carboxylesterase
VDPDLAIRPPGPWFHRDVSANGSRFHVAELGEGPTVIFLHGFPTFWWTWRHAMAAVAAQGYRAVAMDLRGYAGSDHPPEGYDPTTLAADVAGVIKGLGADDATVVGHGWGGIIGWTMCSTQPEMVRTLVTISAPHPQRMRSALLRSRSQRSAMGYLWGLQLPISPERSFMRNDGSRITELMRDWSLDTSWLDSDAALRYQSAFTCWPTAHTAIEYHRWAMRSMFRTDGRRYMTSIEAPITHDVLSVRGQQDPMVLEESFDGDHTLVNGRYESASLPTGHFVHEESPDNVSGLLIKWLAQEVSDSHLPGDGRATN